MAFKLCISMPDFVAKLGAAWRASISRLQANSCYCSLGVGFAPETQAALETYCVPAAASSLILAMSVAYRARGRKLRSCRIQRSNGEFVVVPEAQAVSLRNREPPSLPKSPASLLTKTKTVIAPPTSPVQPWRRETPLLAGQSMGRIKPSRLKKKRASIPSHPDDLASQSREHTGSGVTSSGDNDMLDEATSGNGNAESAAACDDATPGPPPNTARARLRLVAGEASGSMRLLVEREMQQHHLQDLETLRKTLPKPVMRSLQTYSADDRPVSLPRVFERHRRGRQDCVDDDVAAVKRDMEANGDELLAEVNEALEVTLVRHQFLGYASDSDTDYSSDGYSNSSSCGADERDKAVNESVAGAVVHSMPNILISRSDTATARIKAMHRTLSSAPTQQRRSQRRASVILLDRVSTMDTLTKLGVVLNDSSRVYVHGDAEVVMGVQQRRTSSESSTSQDDIFNLSKTYNHSLLFEQRRHSNDNSNNTGNTCSGSSTSNMSSSSLPRESDDVELNRLRGKTWEQQHQERREAAQQQVVKQAFQRRRSGQAMRTLPRRLSFKEAAREAVESKRTASNDDGAESPAEADDNGKHSSGSTRRRISVAAATAQYQQQLQKQQQQQGEQQQTVQQQRRRRDHRSGQSAAVSSSIAATSAQGQVTETLRQRVHSLEQQTAGLRKSVIDIGELKAFTCGDWLKEKHDQLEFGGTHSKLEEQILPRLETRVQSLRWVPSELARRVDITIPQAQPLVPRRLRLLAGSSSARRGRAAQRKRFSYGKWYIEPERWGKPPSTPATANAQTERLPSVLPEAATLECSRLYKQYVVDNDVREPDFLREIHVTKSSGGKTGGEISAISKAMVKVPVSLDPAAARLIRLEGSKHSRSSRRKIEIYSNAVEEMIGFSSKSSQSNARLRRW